MTDTSTHHSANNSSNNNDNNRRQHILLISLLVTVVLGLIYWAYTKLEWEEKEIDLGYSKEARQNPFLAAEIFLRKHGIQATSVKNLSLLDKHRWRNIELGPEDTLVLINANKTLDDERYDALYEWIENGGTLITSTQNPFIGTHTNKEDLLLSDFGITPADEEAEEGEDFFESLADELDEKNKQKKEKPDDKTSDANSTADNNENTTGSKDTRATTGNKDIPTKDAPEKPENYYRCSLDEHPSEIEFADEAKPLRFDFSYEEPFTHRWNDDHEQEEFIEADYATEEHRSTEQGNATDDASIKSDIEPPETQNNTQHEETIHLAYFDIGEGSITITSDNYIWSNRRIDCHDHAYALWSLVNPNGRVWFLINQDAPSLAAIIWQQARYAVLAVLLALIFWLWAKGTRFGPVFIVEQQGRRSLAEHIYASAMLLWRKQQHPQLLTLLREEILVRMEQQHPQLLIADSKNARIILVRELTGLKENDIRQALYADDLYHPQTFATAIAHLQIIRKQL